MPGIAQPVAVLSVIVMPQCAPTGAMSPFPPVASMRIGTPPQFVMVLRTILRSLLVPASSHQYSGETRIADIQQPSIRLPVISP